MSLILLETAQRGVLFQFKSLFQSKDFNLSTLQTIPVKLTPKRKDETSISDVNF